VAAKPGIVRIGACLSLSGRYARFGRQAAAALETWRRLDGGAELVIEDDESAPRVLETRLPGVARNCDILLGPYSTQLARAAARIAGDKGLLVWNHGGSGDDVEASAPGHMISVLAPASRYAESFIACLAGLDEQAPLWIAQGKGSFGRQVAEGTESAARRRGLPVHRVSPDELPAHAAVPWDLFSAGTFESDVEVIRQARQLRVPPRAVCAVAAGVRDFAAEIAAPEGIYGVGQWFAGTTPPPRLGPAEPAFLGAYTAASGTAPDYPAAQALAAAVLAAHCARLAGSTARDAVWPTAAELDTSTLFGAFRIDPGTGVQIGHQPALVRWSAAGLVAA
jgi:ABC-type branched-subunit amino acid transport system substrate-binding protein